MESLLTIGIPTYNRPLQIQKQVRLILPQINSRVSLVVFDNCSKEMVKDRFTENELNQFTIIRNRCNIGGDANIARCFENCLTPWLWTLSDDDYIKSNGIEIVLDAIENNFESVFLNFNSDHYFKTIGFKQLATEFRSSKVFGNSFAMSSCAYNLSKLQNTLHEYYSNLSSGVGTLILVLKYVQNNDQSICEFIKETPIEDYNTEVGWNYEFFIRRSRQFIEAFDNEKNQKYNRTLFWGCFKTSYILIIMNRKESNIVYWRRWKVFELAIHNQGIFDALRFNPKLIIFTFLYLILQHRRLNWILRFIKKISGKLFIIK